MNMFKRMASIVILAVMVLQTVAFAAPVPTDVIGTEYEAAASMLCALEIMVGDGKKFKPDDDITRAEFAQIMMKSLALDSAAEAYEPKGLFTDVPKKNIFAPAIELGAGIGAIKGYGDGIFGPNDKVKGTEAVKMMVYAAGHDVTAEGNGGYPSGYMAVAKEIGMLKGISNIDFSVPMTRGQAAILCANTLKVDMKKKVTTGEKITYVEQKDVNLLSEKHDTYKVEGVVSANDITSLYQASTLRDNNVQIDSAITSGTYNIGETTIDEALGAYVKAYYKYDADAAESKILSYEVLENRTTVHETTLDNIVYSTVTDTYVEYWVDKENDSRPQDLDIASSMLSIIYNGTVRTTNTTVSATFAEVQGKKGDAKFIDNNNDGYIDVVIVNAYDIIAIKKISYTDYTITDEIGTYTPPSTTPKKKTIKVDVAAANMRASIVDMEGEEVAFDDLSVGDVLSVAMSDEGTARRCAKIIVSQETVDGTVTDISTKDGKYVIGIDSTKYEITDSYFDYITKGQRLSAPANAISVQATTSGTFMLDSFGRIAFDEITSVTENATFALLKTYAPGKGADTTLKFRLYADGEFVEYGAADKVVVDGVAYKGDTIKTALDTSLAYVYANTTFENTEITHTGYYDGKTQVSPVLFSLNDDEEITMIDTPYLNTAGGESEFSLQPLKGETLQVKKNVYYNSGTSTLAGVKYGASDTQAIKIPGDYANIDTAKYYDVMTTANLPSRTDESYDMQLLTVEPDSYNVAYAVVIGKAETSAAPASSAFFEIRMTIISEVSLALNEENDKVLTFTGVTDGREKEYTVDPNYYSSGDLYDDVWTDQVKTQFPGIENDPEFSPTRKEMIFVPGDCIRLHTNSFGDVVWVDTIYYADVKIARSPEQNYIDGGRYPVFETGIINEIVDDSIRVSFLVDRTLAATENGGNVILTNDATSGNGKQTYLTRLTVNDRGFVTGAKSPNSNIAGDRNLILYDDATKSYNFSDVNGVRFSSVYDPSAFSVTVFNPRASQGNQVYVGTIDDMADTSTPTGTPASFVIVHMRGSGVVLPAPRGMYVVKF